MSNKPDIESIQRLVGLATEEQIRFIDSYLFEDVGVFLPVAGPCYYALSPEHTHPSYMIIYSFKGEGGGWIKGIEQDSLKPGEFLFMAPHIVHQESMGSDTPKYLAVFIRPELFVAVAEEYNLSMDQLKSTVEVGKAHKQFLSLCWQFIAEVNSIYQPNRSLLHAISVQIIHSIIRSVFHTSGHSQNVDWRMEIGQSIAFIHSHLHEKVGLKDIANSVNMSVPNFSRVFKKEVGQTPIEYLLEQRLNKAQSMIVADEFSMQDVATSCGFSSVSYLSTSFRKRYSVSPEKYKHRMKIGE